MDYVAEAATLEEEVMPWDLEEELEGGATPLILDIREQKEFTQGHIAGAYNLPASVFDKKVSEIDRHKAHPVVVVCKMGSSAGSIAKTLKKRGFENVVRLAGGMSEWTAASLPTKKGKSS